MSTVLDELFLVIRTNPDPSGTATVFGVYQNIGAADNNISEFNKDPGSSGLYVIAAARVGIFFSDTLGFGDGGKVENKFLKSAESNHTSLDSCPIALADGKVLHITVSTEKLPENNWFLQVITNAVKGEDGVFSGGTQIGTNLEKPAGQLDKVFTNLVGFNFSKGDRIQTFIKKGTLGEGQELGKAFEPCVRLMIQYTGTI